MISLLFTEGKRVSTFEKENFESLMLRDALQKVIPEKEKREFFFSLLAEPLIHEEDILFRQAILRDFLLHRSLLSDLQSLFDQMIVAALDYNKAKQAMKNGNQRTRGKTVDSETKMLSPVCVLLKNLLSVIGRLSSRMAGLPLSSDGLNRLSKRLFEMARAEKIHELSGILSHFETLRAWNMTADIAFSLDEFSRICEIRYLTESQSLPPQNPTTSTKKGTLFSKKVIEQEEITSENAVPLNLNTYTADRIVGEAISDIVDMFIDIANSILSEFSGIGEDLVFYECALRICDRFHDNGLPFTFPVLGREMKITSLYDIYLSFCSEKPVIPNDVLLPTSASGVLIFGDNGSGKTVFLRSITNAVLFSQQGLPIPASDATVTVLPKLNVLMASAENTLGIAEDAGRFEEEVQKMARLLKASPCGTLILLNEIFQTTSYKEGAEGLYPILQYLDAQGVKWICVTHLPELIEFFRNDASVVKIKVENRKVKYQPIGTA